MPLTQDEVNGLYSALYDEHKCPLVFFYNELPSDPFIMYSKKNGVLGEAFSGVSDAVQYIMQKNNGFYHKKIELYISGDYNRTPLCTGMINFNRGFGDKNFTINPFVPNYINQLFRPELPHDSIFNKYHVRMEEMPDDYWSYDGESDNDFGPDPQLDLTLTDKENKPLHRIYMMLAFMNLKKYMVNSKNSLGYNIAALLVNRDGTIVEASVNEASGNMTHHAETNLLQRLSKRGVAIGDGSVLYTTLKPCKMCAGTISNMFSGKVGCKVIYAQDDPGYHAVNTCLDGGNILKKLSSYKDITFNKTGEIYQSKSSWQTSHMRIHPKNKYGSRMESSFNQIKLNDNQASLVQFLDNNQGKGPGRMLKSVEELHRKLNKYGTALPGMVVDDLIVLNPRVLKLMKYLEPVIHKQGMD